MIILRKQGPEEMRRGSQEFRWLCDLADELAQLLPTRSWTKALENLVMCGPDLENLAARSDMDYEYCETRWFTLDLEDLLLLRPEMLRPLLKAAHQDLGLVLRRQRDIDSGIGCGCKDDLRALGNGRDSRCTAGHGRVFGYVAYAQAFCTWLRKLVDRVPTPVGAKRPHVVEAVGHDSVCMDAGVAPG
jgi:hypothetical protein